MFAASFEVFAQTLEKENTYKISGKSKRGALGDVSYDADKGTYTLTYVTKSNDRKAKFEKVKSKSDEGEKYRYLAHAEDENTGNVLILVVVFHTDPNK